MPSNSFSNRLYKYISNYPLYTVYIPLSLYWVFLFGFTTLPTDKVPHFFDNQDKIEHLVAYAVLSFLLTLALFLQKKSNFLALHAYLFSIVLIISYAAIDELHQLIVPGRYCDFYDWCADSIGGFIGILLVFLLWRNQLNRKLNSVTQKTK